MSGDAEEYAFNREVEDVVGVVEGIDEPVTLLGHSYGAPFEFWEMAASNLPVFMQEQNQLAEEGGDGPTDSSTLARINVPVLLLQGQRSRSWFKTSVRHIAGHVQASQVVEISSDGHFGPHTEPEAIAGKIARFFSK